MNTTQTKTALPERLAAAEQHGVPGRIIDPDWIGQEGEPREVGVVSLIFKDDTRAFANELAHRYNAYNKILAYASHFRTCQTWDKPNADCDCGYDALTHH